MVQFIKYLQASKRVFAVCAAVLSLNASAQDDAARSFSYEDLLELINKNDVRSIPQLNSLLPPEIRFSNTFMTKSGGLQEADALNSDPLDRRAIIFGEDASLILTHNAGPHKKGGNTLEIGRWHSNERRLELRQGIVDKNGIERIRFSDPNPRVCLGCHDPGHRAGREPDPIWKWDEAYTWPGSDGEFSDVIALQSTNGQNFLEFKALAKDHDRFKHLFEPSSNPVHPYSPTDELRYSKDTRMPNAGLTMQIAAMNGLRIARLVQQDPRFDALKHTVLFTFAGCNALEESFDERPRHWERWMKKLGAQGEPSDEAMIGALLAILKLSRRQISPAISTNILLYRDGTPNSRRSDTTHFDYAAAAIANDLSRSGQLTDIAIPPAFDRVGDLKALLGPDFETVFTHIRAADKVQPILDLRDVAGRTFCEKLKAKAEQELEKYSQDLTRHAPTEKGSTERPRSH